MLVSRALQVPMIQLETEKTATFLGNHIDEVIPGMIMGNSLSTFEGDHMFNKQY